MKINKNIIKELNDYLDEFNLTEIEYTEKDIKVKVSKSRISKNIETVVTNNKKEVIKEEVSIDNSKKITSPIIELHISNIYKREDFRHKSLISAVVTGIICGLGINGYILAINSMHEILKNEN